MDFPKKQQQSLIPRYLLQYLTSLEYHHTDPTAPWGGGGGGSYTAGDGIDITNDVISIDDTVALKTDLSDYVTSTALATELLDYAELSDLATVATSGDYNDLLNKPTIPVVPTNVSAFTNDAGYITSSNLSNYVTLNGIQTITGSKTFTGLTVFKGTNYNVFFGQSAGLDVCDKNNPSQEAMTIHPGFLSSYRDTGNTSLDGRFHLGNHEFSAYNSDTEYKIKLVSKGGATTYGEYTFKNKTGDVAITSEIPTATSDLTNDSGYITSSALSGYATETWVSNQGYLVSSDLTNYITSTDLAAELLNYAELSDLATVATTGDYDDLLNTPDLSVYELAADAFSGDYDDLTNKPTIPDEVSGTNDGTNWTSLTIGSDTYDIPAGGSSGPTVTKYTNTDSYMGSGGWSGSITCPIYNGRTGHDEFNLNNANPGDILIFDITLRYNSNGIRYQRQLIKVVVPSKSTNTSFAGSHNNLAITYEPYKLWASNLSDNFITIRLENINSTSSNYVSMGELTVPNYLGSGSSGAVIFNSITHIAY